MKATGLIAMACAAALTVACGGDARDDTATTRDGIEQNDTISAPEVDQDNRVGTTGAATEADRGVRNFAEQAAKGGAAEIELGRLASERAQNADVRQFAQMMVRDHTASSEALKQAASAHGLQLVGELPDDKEDLLEKLRGMKGAAFDQEYMQAMVDAHQDMRSAVRERVDDSREEKSNDALETAINQWAAKALPTVEQHLKTAEQINDKLENGRNSTN